MPTYTNLGIKEITTGDEAGTWGTSTNTNFEYFDDAIVGSATVSLIATGSAGSPNTLNTANFAPSDGRKRIIEVTSVGDLGGTCYLQITPNTFHGYYFITNTLAGGRNLTVFQGTWNGTDPNRAITITNGKQTIIKCDGAGIASVVTRVLNNFETGSITADGSGLTGSAPNLSTGKTTVAVDDATAVPVYPVWGDGATGAVNTYTSSTLTYQPNTGELSTTVLTASIINGTAIDGTFVGELSGETYSTNDTVVAGTNAQGQGALTADYNVVITTANNPSGVTLPAAVTGRRIIIVNKGTNSINIYPATGDAIDALSVNTPIGLTVDGWMEFNASSLSQWYSTANIVVNATGAVTSFSAGSTGLTPSGATTGAVTLGGTLAITNGGTGQTTASAAFNALSPITSTGDLIIGNGANSATRLPISINNGYVLTSNGTTASWQAPGSTGVSSFSAGTTGLTPSTGTTGAVTLAGTLAIANGGTGQTTKSAAYNALTPITTTGDLVIGNGTNSATRLPISANNGYVLTSNGTTAAWALPGSSVTDVGTTNATYYPTFTTTTSGAASLNVSSTRYSLNPFTGNFTAAGTISGSTFTSTVATGTAPFTVTSTTEVANLKAATATNAVNIGVTLDNATATAIFPVLSDTATTGNKAAKVSSTFGFYPSTGTIGATRFISAATTGTAPFTVSSTTLVSNLNAQYLSGATFAAPGAIGSGTASTGQFTAIGSGVAPDAATTGAKILGKGSSTSSTTYAIQCFDSGGSNITLQVRDDGNFKTGTVGSLAPYNYAPTNTPRVAYVNSGGSLQSYDTYANTTANAANVNVSTAGILRLSTSSIRYKKDVENLIPGLAETLQLRPVTYKSKIAEDGDDIFIGLIAEEVDAIPGLQPFVARSEEGLPNGLSYSNMVALLVNAIKEQNAVIEALTARVAALEAK